MEERNSRKIDKFEGQVADLWKEELGRSYDILKKVIEPLPLEARKEFVELLRILAEENPPRNAA